MNNPSRQPAGQLPPMEAPPDLAIHYVNLVRIAHSPSELVFDFAHLLPAESGPKIAARVVMSPLGAKLFFRALAENLNRFETAFGEIRVPGEPSLIENLFHPPSPTDPNQG